MASSEKVHYSIFPIAGSINERGIILHVRESRFTASTTLVAGTTLANFMSAEAVDKGDAIEQGFGSYIYCEQLPKEGNNLRFVFLKSKTPAEQLQVVKPSFTINETTYWPDWLLSLYALEAEIALQSESGVLGIGGNTSNAVTGKRILDRYILFKGGEFNTIHEIDEFFSPDPITSLSATEPRPMPVFYNYYGVRNSLNCIHAGVTVPEPYITATLVENFGTPNAQKVTWEQGSVFPPTNQVAWIPHYRKLIVTERDGGFYYRRHKVLPPRLNRAIQI
jgi:hypothetical protein